MFELLINDGKSLFEPVVCGDVVYESFARGRCGKLTFSVLCEDEKILIREGATVSFKSCGKGVFFGIVFTVKRDSDGVLSVCAYDQIRYLKNKDAYVYTNKKASDVVRLIASDYRLKLGEVSETNYIIPSRVEDNVSLLDIIERALDIELSLGGGRYILFDDFGALTLKKESELRTNIVLDKDTVGSFRFSSSSDNRFNRVKVSRFDRKTGRRENFFAKDEASEKSLGILQKYETANFDENADLKARSLLKLYDRDAIMFSVSAAIGDVSVRGGSGVIVKLGGRDDTAFVLRATHRFGAGTHFMDLELEF